MNDIYFKLKTPKVTNEAMVMLCEYTSSTPKLLHGFTSLNQRLTKALEEQMHIKSKLNALLLNENNKKLQSLRKKVYPFTLCIVIMRIYIG